MGEEWTFTGRGFGGNKRSLIVGLLSFFFFFFDFPFPVPFLGSASVEEEAEEEAEIATEALSASLSLSPSLPIGAVALLATVSDVSVLLGRARAVAAGPLAAVSSSSMSRADGGSLTIVGRAPAWRRVAVRGAALISNQPPRSSE